MLRFRLFGIGVLIAALTACSGGGGGNNLTPFSSSNAVNSSAATSATTVTDLSRWRFGDKRIYVTTGCGSTSGSVVTYNATSGAQITPPIITTGFGPCGVAIDAAGKIYVTNYWGGSVVVYTANGQQVSAFSAGDQPTQVAIGSNGRIYVGDWADGFPISFVTTYIANGAQTTPTIQVLFPSSLAVGPHGKIYVSDTLMDASGNPTTGAVTTYNENGKRIAPTMAPNGCVAVGPDNKLYVANGNTVRTYTAEGRRISPTITAGLNNPIGIAVDSAGNVYVLNGGYADANATVTAYTANGTRTTPTITGLGTVASIAVH